MKKINLTKFPVKERDGSITEVNIAKDFLEMAYKAAMSREDVIFNLSLKEDQDIELTDQCIDYMKRYLSILDQKIYLYSFEEYIAEK